MPSAQQGGNVTIEFGAVSVCLCLSVSLSLSITHEAMCLQLYIFV